MYQLSLNAYFLINSASHFSANFSEVTQHSDCYIAWKVSFFGTFGLNVQTLDRRLTSSVLHQVMQLPGILQKLHPPGALTLDPAAHCFWCPAVHTLCRHLEKNFSDPTFTYTLTHIGFVLKTHACQSFCYAQLFTLHSVLRGGEELCPLGPGRWWCSPSPNPLCPTKTAGPAWSPSGQKRAAPSPPPSAGWRTQPDKAAASLWETPATNFTFLFTHSPPFMRSLILTWDGFDYENLSGCVVAAFVDGVNLSEQQKQQFILPQ